MTSLSPYLNPWTLFYIISSLPAAEEGDRAALVSAWQSQKPGRADQWWCGNCLQGAEAAVVAVLCWLLVAHGTSPSPTPGCHVPVFQWLALVVLRNSTFCTLQWVIQFYASSPYLTSQGWHPPENTKADKCEKSYHMRFGRRVFSTSVKLKEVPGERKPAAAARIKRQLFEPNLIF